MEWRVCICWNFGLWEEARLPEVVHICSGKQTPHKDLHNYTDDANKTVPKWVSLFL